MNTERPFKRKNPALPKHDREVLANHSRKVAARNAFWRGYAERHPPVGPSCPECGSTKTKRMDIEHEPNLWDCFDCGIWFDPVAEATAHKEVKK